MSYFNDIVVRYKRINFSSSSEESDIFHSNNDVMQKNTIQANVFSIQKNIKCEELPIKFARINPTYLLAKEQLASTSNLQIEEGKKVYLTYLITD